MFSGGVYVIASVIARSRYFVSRDNRRRGLLGSERCEESYADS